MNDVKIERFLGDYRKKDLEDMGFVFNGKKSLIDVIKEVTYKKSELERLGYPTQSMSHLECYVAAGYEVTTCNTKGSKSNESFVGVIARKDESKATTKVENNKINLNLEELQAEKEEILKKVNQKIRKIELQKDKTHEEKKREVEKKEQELKENQDVLKELNEMKSEDIKTLMEFRSETQKVCEKLEEELLDMKKPAVNLLKLWNMLDEKNKKMLVAYMTLEEDKQEKIAQFEAMKTELEQPEVEKNKENKELLSGQYMFDFVDNQETQEKRMPIELVVVSETHIEQFV